MKAQVMAWWRERSLREQRMLLVMLALLVVTFLWLGLYRPLANGLSSTRERHQNAVIRLGEVRAQVDALKGFSTATGFTGPVAEVVTQSAGTAGFANATIAPQGDRRVSVSIPSARPGPLFSWVARLEAQGLIVERLSARANSDPTLAVDMTLAAGGR